MLCHSSTKGDHERIDLEAGKMEIKCRVLSEGKARGRALLSNKPLSFLGGVDPKTGVVIDSRHPLRGKSIKDKVLIIPGGKGSTVGSYVIFQLAKNKKAPAAIICMEAEPIIATGAIIAGIPLVDKPEEDVMKIIKESMEVEVDARAGIIKIL